MADHDLIDDYVAARLAEHYARAREPWSCNSQHSVAHTENPSEIDPRKPAKITGLQRSKFDHTKTSDYGAVERGCMSYWRLRPMGVTSTPLDA
jgi:hypothetical protein